MSWKNLFRRAQDLGKELGEKKREDMTEEDRQKLQEEVEKNSIDGKLPLAGIFKIGKEVLGKEGLKKVFEQAKQLTKEELIDKKETEVEEKIEGG